MILIIFKEIKVSPQCLPVHSQSCSMRQLDIFKFILEQMEGHVALRVGFGRTTPNEDF